MSHKNSVARLRARLRMNQAQFMAVIGVKSAQRVSQIENAMHEPSFGYLQNAARWMKANGHTIDYTFYDWLFRG